jgi:hypothetical protein
MDFVKTLALPFGITFCRTAGTASTTGTTDNTGTTGTTGAASAVSCDAQCDEQTEDRKSAVAAHCKYVRH